LTGDQRHTDYISTGQQLSRHSLPTLLYFLFSPPHIFFNSILASRTFGTFAFAPSHKANASAKAKEPNHRPHRMTFVARTNNFLRILTNINLKKLITALLIEDEII
jgi:hypothetical protein